jgi:choline dehydrogenase-like flavoprotein
MNSRPTRLLEEHIPAFISSPHGMLMSDRQVTQLVTIDGRRVDHVETRAIGEREPRRYRARVYVLAAGAIENPRILLLSKTTQHPHGLGNNHGLVGRHFNAHPSLQAMVSGPTAPGHPFEDECRTAFHERYRIAGLNAAHVHFKRSNADQFNIRVQPEIEARPENRVSLSDSKFGQFGEPVPDISLTYSERDTRTLNRCARLRTELVDLFSTTESRVDESRVWRAHPAGTTRMGAREEEGVVDPSNKVFGLDNLYVSGSSTFPTSGTANPTNLVVAMTLRLADHLIGRLEA